MIPFRWLVLIGILLVPLVWALWLTEVVSFSFARLGLSPGVTGLVLLGSLVGGRTEQQLDDRYGFGGELGIPIVHPGAKDGPGEPGAA